MKKVLFVLCCFLTSMAWANDPSDSSQLFLDALKKADSIESTLHYKTGTFTLGGGIATVTIPKGFKFLEGGEAKYVIEDLWGNLKGQQPLGMIFPESSSAALGGYAFIIQYEAMGYVKDSDADDINYDDLLKELKEGSNADNEERKKLGLSTLHLIGWAAKPFYDKEKKILHWAKEFKVAGEEENTLNYDIRVLGRKGVLTLQAVASMNELDSVNKNIDKIIGMVSFNKGNQYSDFDSSTDDVAAWTIGGLVAGKILTKVGFFAIILKYLKVILLGLVAVGGSIWRFITGKKKKEEDPIYESEPLEIKES